MNPYIAPLVAPIAVAGLSAAAQPPPPVNDRYDPAAMDLKPSPAKITDVDALNRKFAPHGLSVSPIELDAKPQRQ